MPTDHHAKRHRGCGPRGEWLPHPDNAKRRVCDACGTDCTCSTCKAARAPLLEVPNACVVLGVDAAARSGWSIWNIGEWVASGEVRAKRLDEAGPVVKRARLLATAQGVPCVLAIEVSAFQGMTSTTAHGLGKSVGQWLMAWIEGSGVEAHIVECQAREWRTDLWGESPPTDEARNREQCEAQAIVMQRRMGPIGPEESPAVLIGRWGSHCQAVNAVLPKKHRQEAAA